MFFFFLSFSFSISRLRCGWSSRSNRSHHHHPTQEHQCDGWHVWGHAGVCGQCQVFACVTTALPPTPNNIACEQLSGHVGQNCLFLSLCPDPSLSSTLHGVRMVWWSIEDWEISDDDWPSAGLWSVTAAITSARHHYAAAVSQPSLLELTYMWSVDPSHTYSS